MDSCMLLVLLACLTLCSTAPTVTPETDALPEDEETLAKNYLSHFYGDVGNSNSAMRRFTRPSLNDSLKSMQSFFGLEVTGILDNETVKVMKEPRCGVPDIGPSRYAHFYGTPRWHHSLITYRILNYNHLLHQSQIDATIAKAFKVYSDVIPLNFIQVYSGEADMMILFGSGDHGDWDPFDGRNGVLAHATAPGWGEGGDTHFDNDEYWTLTDRGINLLLVAAHEFGHALGLDHSRDRSALMYPTYRYVQTYGYKLPDDDRRGVQALYGVRAQPQPPPPDLGPNPQNDRCSKDLAFDASTSLRGDLLFFKNGYFWTKSTLFQGIRFTKVSTQWPQIYYVDAAYEVPNEDQLYLIEGRNYWGIRASANTILPGYPQPLTNLGLPSYVNKVDAAVYVPTTGKTLFFVNSQYWSYDEHSNRMDNGHPRYITSDFPGVTSKVDAVFLNGDLLYFCDGPKQSEYILADKTVKRGLLNYWWLNCF